MAKSGDFGVVGPIYALRPSENNMVFEFHDVLAVKSKPIFGDFCSLGAVSEWF